MLMFNLLNYDYKAFQKLALVLLNVFRLLIERSFMPAFTMVHLNSILKIFLADKQ